MERQAWDQYGQDTIFRYKLMSETGVVLVVSNLGATVLSCQLPTLEGEPVEVTLGCDTVEQYLASGTYFGATVGRYGNRIRKGCFDLDGRTHRLTCNEGENHLHGGGIGFDKRVWTVGHYDADSISFSIVSEDGDEGYPGALVARARYSVSGDTVTYELLATVDAPSPVNLMNHVYWNLAGTGDVLDHIYQFDADFYTPADPDLMPTGEIASVTNTPFDFRSPRTARERYKQISNPGAGRITGHQGGYDHNLVLNNYNGEIRTVGRVKDPKSGRAMRVATTEPGLHLYMGGYLAGVTGRECSRYEQFAGFTLETQKFPDSPNLGHFPSCVLHPGQVYRHVTQLSFEY